ncbi:MAG: hypothetical protein AVDCRST_MAG50-2861 [uncultured Acidimicrobiales bacterium]|uniref:Lipid/polyisoprenoid-binding YceI-like domain-containing protein n=1 Tax=uncultured Acidimicrobiales bacterium TaxID=310071 RepID=A0A6J4IXU4_9ACTN|nr:MAG: hypothetical protein AVDCRST_MAG50-2861 [uncultured Acidimicrobiales bacterium]
MRLPTSRGGRVGVLALAVLAPLALFVAAYLLFLNPEPEAAFQVDAGGGTGAPAGVADVQGAWRVTDGSEAGYRVREKLASLPAPNDAVGRTTAITGGFQVEPAGEAARVRDIKVDVDVSKLTSDSSQRDNRIKSQGLESNRFPMATFVSIGTIDVPAEALTGATVKAQVAGDLTIHGATNRVDIPVDVALTAGKAQIVGTYTFPFAAFGMTPPSIGGFVTVENDATLEFKMVATKG